MEEKQRNAAKMYHTKKEALFKQKYDREQVM